MILKDQCVSIASSRSWISAPIYSLVLNNGSNEARGSEKEKTYKPRKWAVAEEPVTFIHIDENG